ncbi:hypothetical protein PR048_009140, partial [Dryococelus australis]
MHYIDEMMIPYKGSKAHLRWQYTDKQLSTYGYGSYDQKVDDIKKVSVVKWYDNRAVVLASSYVSSNPVTMIKRYIKTEKGRKVPSNLTLKQFRVRVADGLQLHGKPKKGRPSSEELGVEQRKKIRKLVTARPGEDIRNNVVGHFPVFTSK